jgi:hypothetical protein
MANVRIGGLFRCCVQTASEMPEGHTERITCRHCGEAMVWVDGAYEWETAAPGAAPREPGERQ